MFNKITEAYNILSDKSKRSLYDTTGIGSLDSIDPMDIFNNMFNGYKPDLMNTFTEGLMGNVRTVNIDTSSLNEFLPDVMKTFSSVLSGEDINKKVATNVINKVNKTRDKPKEISKVIDASLEDIYNEYTKKVKLNIYENNKKVSKVFEIPLYANKEIKFRNKGHQKLNYKERGDIKFLIKCEGDSKFKINNYDLIYNKDISVSDYYIKRDFEIILPNYDKIIINTKDKIIKNKGLPRPNDETRGDIIINYNIKLPELDNLDEIDKLFPTLL